MICLDVLEEEICDHENVYWIIINLALLLLMFFVVAAVVVYFK